MSAVVQSRGFLAAVAMVYFVQGVLSEKERVRSLLVLISPRSSSLIWFWCLKQEHGNSLDRFSKARSIEHDREERKVRKWRKMIGVGGSHWKHIVLISISHSMQQLVIYETSASELDIIRDISRTSPSHVFFQRRHGLGQRSLYNICKAYSVYDRDVGYVQGMGFIAGLLLLYMSEDSRIVTSLHE